MKEKAPKFSQILELKNVRVVAVYRDLDGTNGGHDVEFPVNFVAIKDGEIVFVDPDDLGVFDECTAMSNFKRFRYLT